MVEKGDAYAVDGDVFFRVKKISDYGYDSLDNFNEDVVPKSNTDQKGLVKPMLCNQYDFNDSKLEKITWKASTKLDGLRTMLYYKDGNIYTSSRGGKDYNIAATYIRKDAYLQNLFKENPNLILDGELYKHGWNLQKISGLGRLETLHEDHKKLQFHCYDIVDENKTFNERYKLLKTFEQTEKFIVVEHVDVKGNDNINKLHDEYVEQGYEGLVLRDPSKKYKCGSRSNRMLKVKKFVDAEFEVIEKGFIEEFFAAREKARRLILNGKRRDAVKMLDELFKKQYEQAKKFISELNENLKKGDQRKWKSIFPMGK